jgi:hypothetical protein
MALLLFLVAVILAVVAETISFPSDDIVYPPIVAYVILSFLGQAVFGMALLRTGLGATWVGWVTVIWNLAVSVCPIITRPQDISMAALCCAALHRNCTLAEEIVIMDRRKIQE